MTWPKSRVSSAEGRWTSSSSPSSRRRTCTSSGPATSAFSSARSRPTVGFRLHVVDDRQKFANHERFPAADEVVVESLDQWVTTARDPRLVVCRGAHARPSAGLRRAARVVEPHLPLCRPHRQPRKGRPADRGAHRGRRRRPSGSSSCARPSALTSAPCRRKKSPWPSWPNSSRFAAARSTNRTSPASRCNGPRRRCAIVDVAAHPQRHHPDDERRLRGDRGRRVDPGRSHRAGRAAWTTRRTIASSTPRARS